MDNSALPINHPHHTKLVIILAIVIILALIFFGLRFKNGYDASPVVDQPTNMVPLELRRSPLTAEQAASLKTVLSDESLSTRKTLTTKQKADLKKVLEDPLLRQGEGSYGN